ncbi:MAG: 2-C-methyl-D-erythritol 2,4-cyclodiphosphate synthase [Candidatus Anammoxibacter sp.]
MLLGIGYDIHRLIDNRKLIMGGILFDTTYGLDGHSDADVVLHAVCDALLGASALGDIGEHFPDTDPKWKGVSSEIITDRIIALVKEKGYYVNNIDVNIIAERPKINSRKINIKENIAKLLDVDANRVNVKAKTNEGLDAIGRGEAISSQVIVSLNENRKNI